MTLGKLGTGLGVPLLREGVVVGVIALGRGRVQPLATGRRTYAPSDRHHRAGECSADQRDARKALEQQTATAEVRSSQFARRPGPVFRLGCSTRRCRPVQGAFRVCSPMTRHFALSPGAVYTRIRGCRTRAVLPPRVALRLRVVRGEAFV